MTVTLEWYLLLRSSGVVRLAQCRSARALVQRDADGAGMPTNVGTARSMYG